MNRNTLKHRRVSNAVEDITNIMETTYLLEPIEKTIEKLGVYSSNQLNRNK